MQDDLDGRRRSFAATRRYIWAQLVDLYSPVLLTPALWSES